MVRISSSRLDMEDGRIDRGIFKDYGETLVGGFDGHKSGIAYLVDVAGPKSGGAIILNEDGYFQASSPQTAVTNWSISAWLKPALSQTGIAVYNGDDSGGYGFGVIANGGGAGSTLSGLFGNVNWLTTGYTFSDSNWHHVVMTRDTTTTRFYVDGSLLATTFADTPGTVVSAFTIGVQLNSARQVSRMYKGGIDEVRFYDSALSLGDVQTLYALGSVSSGLLAYWNLDDGTGRTALDSSGNANHATAYGNPMWSTNGSNAFHVVLTANCTISFSAASPVGSAQTFTLFLKQDAVGGRTVTWPSSVQWVQGYAPTLTSQKNRYDIFSFTTTTAGATWLGFVSSQNFEEKVQAFGWGASNIYGVLGLNDTADRSSPVQIGSLVNWSQLSPSDGHMLALKSDGTIWGWGLAMFGAFGNNTATDLRSSPIQIGNLSTWAKVSSGNLSSFGIKTDGTLWSWGYNDEGQLGINTTTHRSSPTQIGAASNWADITTIKRAALALKTDGTLWSWGRNVNGELGLSDDVYRSSPTQVGSGSNWSSVAHSGYAAAAIKTDGTLWTWGYDSTYLGGMLGTNESVSRSSPAQVGTDTNWSVVKCSQSHMVAVRTDGTLWTWGFNSYGVLGIYDVASVSSPVQIGASSDWHTISCGLANILAIKTDGTLWSWGTGSFASMNGALGHGDAVHRSSPTQVGSLTTWKKISSATAISTALRYPQ